MGKCWMFEETGEVRVPQRGEWINKPLEGNFSPHKNYALTKHYPILKFTKYKSNPLEPTREVWERYKGYMDKYSSMQSHDRLPALLSYEFWKAIQESVKRKEGGG